MSEPHVVIYTDGGCIPNPGTGGWGAVLTSGNHTKELKGGEPYSTNNRMELLAAISALEALKHPSLVDLYTDSQYLRDGITTWINQWKRNGWRTADRKPVKNIELWQRLEESMRRHRVRWHWLRGHAGHVLNERADQLVREAIAAVRAGAVGALSGEPSPIAWNRNLDPQSVAYQIAADQSRYIRVLAGPGTGKSFALKSRVARLLESNVQPARILPITFTRVAAEDLQRELINMGVAGCEQIRGSTLHSLGMKILSRQNVLEVTGRTARPLNPFELEPLLYDLPVRFGKKRERENHIRAYEAAWARLQHEEPGFAQTQMDQDFERTLIEWLRFHQGMLIGEIIPELYRYLRNNPDAPERSMYDHVLVDEYQDLNKAEQAVVDLLSMTSSLCVVGDDDQSIYSFKYARPEGIRTFPQTHPGATDHRLLECYRCPTKVVSIANSLIAHNMDREPRQLSAMAANGPGEISIVQVSDITREASVIADFINEQINTFGRNPGEILVLAQRDSIGYPIHAALRAKGIPSKSYYEETELDSEVAQERLAVLKLFVNRADRIALRWLLGTGSPNFRATSYARLRAHCEKTGQTPWDALASLSAGIIQIPYCSGLIERFVAIQNELRFLDEQRDVPDFVNRWLRAEFAGAGELRILVGNLMGSVATPEELLILIIEAVSQPEIPPDVTEVRIMSLHKSKGLSSPIVIIAGCVDGVLPREPEPATPMAERQVALEEQRRLLYVGITRVKAVPSSNRPGSLLLTGSRTMTLADAMRSGIRPAKVNYRTVNLHLSRFIPELGPEAPKPRTA
jgi:DNA helicase-2/ATP-dependent DNA helicase PcrA